MRRRSNKSLMVIKCAWILPLALAGSARLCEANTKKSPGAENLFSVMLPKGKMTFPTGGRWKWSDSCHSRENPCYSGQMGSLGSAYLFAAPAPGADAKMSLAELCKGIHDFTLKNTQGAPEEARPKPLQINKSATGSQYCTWVQGNTFNYFWKAGSSMISIAFSPLQPGTSPNPFMKEVDVLVQGVRIHEK